MCVGLGYASLGGALHFANEIIITSIITLFITICSYLSRLSLHPPAQAMLRVSSRVISRTFTNKAAPASKRAVDVTGPSATKPPPKASSSGSSPLPLLVLVAGAGGFGYMLNSNKEVPPPPFTTISDNPC